MLKLFVAATQLALPLTILASVLVANRSYTPTSRQRVTRATAMAAALGLSSAAVIVWLRLTTRHVRLPMINLWVGVLALLATIVFLVALRLTPGRNLVISTVGWRQRLLTWASRVALFLITLLYGIPLFLAVDQVVPMGGALFASTSLVNLIGYLLGIVVTTTAGVIVTVSLGRSPAMVRSIITTAALGIALATQWPSLYQQFSTARLVPKNSTNFRALLWVQRNDTTILLGYCVLVVIVALCAFLFRRRRVPGGATPAEHRLLRADAISRRRLLVTSAVLGLGIGVTVTLGRRIAEAVPELSPVEDSAVNGEHVEVDIERVSDGHLHRFAYDASGTEVRFIVIQKNATTFGTGLDACEICGPSGYYERDGKLVCRECDVIMNTQTIGFPGGCNPIPLNYEIASDKLLFKVEDLKQQAKVFR